MGIQKLETLKSNWFDTKLAISYTVLGKSIILRHTHTHIIYTHLYIHTHISLLPVGTWHVSWSMTRMKR